MLLETVVNKVGLDLVDSVEQSVFLDLPALPEMPAIPVNLADKVFLVRQVSLALQDYVVGTETLETLEILDSKVRPV